ncbi:Zn-dependent alcohol dehydrogenase [Seongchinamella sediminis]|uniref:Zn-dependent alcohol dehydrogenase n=1 Tax=Seongchinamella sediminis TaxID=2283635 RepID=A0A3L7E2X9_9GAMM|nr:Zn-dependent alcohol dehydrogenase [Seongchinamella sediminis]RLQ23160.1 Zn-dependent alcohol dehydrogenase [Seongchinamella sediminis]
MRAALLEQAGTALVIYDDLEVNQPRTGEVQVEVKYCGLCHSDLGFMTGKSPLLGPQVPGHEAAGVINAVGEGVTHLAVGDPVVLTPAPPCGLCYYCQRQQYSLCDNAIGILSGTLADGSTGLSRRGERVYRGCGIGALAEYVTLPATGAVKIDTDIPLDVACVIGCALQTGVGAVLNTANMEAGATCVVLGLGGIGMATVQGARIAGAELIIASDPVAERRQQAARFGATHVVDPAAGDLPGLIMEVTAGIGVDYAFEAAGRAALIEQGLQLTRKGGTTVIVGSPPLEEDLHIPNVVLFQALEKKLCGCLLGSCNSLYEIPRLLRLWRQGLLDIESMITHRRPLAEVNEGFADLAQGRGIRTVIEIQAPPAP